MTIEERANKIWNEVIYTWHGETAQVEIQKHLREVASEIKKRCAEECEKQVPNYTVVGDYENGFNTAKARCKQAVLNMRIE